MHAQLPLRIGLRDSANYGNFFAGPNAGAVDALQRGTEPFIYLWGAPGSGKTHLLQAACNHETQSGSSALYLSPREYDQLVPEMLEGLDSMPLVCIDDIDSITGIPEWESALFHFYNRIRDAGNRLLVGAPVPPAELRLELPDLRSRLSWGPVFQLHALSDEEKIEALHLRAKLRGIVLPEEVARYLMRRYRRDTHGLFKLLDRLDRASLVAQRRLTVPFVRGLLSD